MKFWRFFLSLSLFLSSTVSEDTVAEDISVHQLERLVEMLTYRECEELLETLSHHEANIFKQIGNLSPENNELKEPKPKTTRYKRELISEREASCSAALKDWVLTYGESMYYDRLSRALQHIGRTDIAIEVGKNINQDKALRLKQHVEDYHKYVSSLNIPSAKPDTKGQRVKQGNRNRKVRDLTWRDLDLIVERTPVPLYQKGPLDVALPLLYGLLLGFGVTLLAVVSVFLFLIHTSAPRSQR